MRCTRPHCGGLIVAETSGVDGLWRRCLSCGRPPAADVPAPLPWSVAANRPPDPPGVLRGEYTRERGSRGKHRAHQAYERHPSPDAPGEDHVLAGRG